MPGQRPIKDIVQDKKWQRVRMSLKGKWKQNPKWCCDQLKKYLGTVRTANDDALRQVANYLTGSGFRTGNIKDPSISKLRGEIFAELKRRTLSVRKLENISLSIPAYETSGQSGKGKSKPTVAYPFYPQPEGG